MLMNSASGGDAHSRGFDTPTLDLVSTTLLHAIFEHGGYTCVSMATLAENGDIRTAEAACVRAWEQLHSGPWHSVLSVWREAYSMACLLVARHHYRNDKFRDALRVLDLGIIMGGTLLRKDLDSAIEKIFEQTRKSVRVSDLGNSEHRLVDRKLVLNFYTLLSGYAQKLNTRVPIGKGKEIKTVTMALCFMAIEGVQLTIPENALVEVTSIDATYHYLHCNRVRFSLHLLTLHCLFGHIYHNLQPRVTKTFLHSFLDPTKALPQHYGAIKGIEALGSRLVPLSFDLAIENTRTDRQVDFQVIMRETNGVGMHLRDGFFSTPNDKFIV
ncbi:Lysine-specific demethylase JMJ30 [Glycine soja]|uniref:Lysine-specific demethylase JMJ30 n=1 Tax=Glycine soja TaxID=3848 RepID=A0A445FSJ3_GLYSO|nr:Lysine-specific demethylase JMJ30 [Glycine soja]